MFLVGGLAPILLAEWDFLGAALKALSTLFMLAGGVWLLIGHRGVSSEKIAREKNRTLTVFFIPACIVFSLGIVSITLGVLTLNDGRDNYAGAIGSALIVLALAYAVYGAPTPEFSSGE
ncbi:hypothetical protein [Ornithinimicrobium sp. INDO-MA30-4]|uniref:hypothetical protein n=1 Tax=Ornithinimicrobium sp. INDO-MA30-4 TaxID=2908651 RepID=UPI001F32597D|nr:hypothetical protein [Ornithinimicrobium sp. INDO-MA30-4]UJH70181.1 hypothetical protein L0A91_13500 [Ornithinimicrobium sp. INDO-MA30-4]